MSVDCIELNDSGVCVFRADGTFECSPGFASIQSGELILGAAARAQARLQPRQTNSRFWQRLGLAALPSQFGKARHHADLAYAHLLALHELAGKPETLLCAVPGSFDREQLGVLLGVVQQCPFRISGLVDSATAASAMANVRGHVLHLDIQLHQSTITHLSIDDTVVRGAVDVLPDTGVAELQDIWSRRISKGFIRQCRFDPLHDAHSEQQLYDQLDRWIPEFNEKAEQLLLIRTADAEHQAKFLVDEIIEAASPIYDLWRQRIGQANADGLLITHRLAALPGVGALLRDAQALAPTALAEVLATHRALIESGDDSLRFVTRLPHLGDRRVETPMSDSITENAAPPPAAPTHILVGAVASPIPSGETFLANRPSSVQQTPLLMSAPEFPAARLLSQDGRIVLSTSAKQGFSVNGKPLEGSLELHCGDRVETAQGISFALIRVCEDGP